MHPSISRKVGDVPDNLRGETSAPPGLKEIAAHWELGAWRELSRFERGMNNESFFLATDRGEFVLRRARSSKTADAMRFEHALTLHLRDHGIPVPEWVPGCDGTCWILAGDMLWSVATFIRSDPVKVNAELIRQVGEILARFHVATSTFQPSVPVPPPASKAKQALKVLATLGSLPDDPQALELAQRMARALPRAATAEAESLASHAGRIIHGGCRRSSVLFRDGRLVGLLDLDSARQGPRGLDLAIALASFARPKKGETTLNMTCARALGAGYTSVLALEAEERQAIPPCLAGALLFQAATELLRFARVPDERKRLARAEARVVTAQWVTERSAEILEVFA